MTAMTAEAKDLTDEFFDEIRKGQRFRETTKDKREVVLHLHDPDILDIDRASDLFDHLNAGADKEDVLETLIRLVCLSCIHDVDEHNVLAFIRAFPPVPKIMIEGLRLLEVSDEQMQAVGINPEGGLMSSVSPTNEFA